MSKEAMATSRQAGALSKTGAAHTGRAPERRFHLWGWILFVFSAIAFIASSIKHGDWIGLAGGFFFLVACFIFLIPLFRPSDGVR